MIVPLPRQPRGTVTARPLMVAVVEPDALLRPVLIDALRAAFEATIVQIDDPARLARLTEALLPDLIVVDPRALGSLGSLGEGAPVLFTDIPPPGARIEADRYAVLGRPFQLDDFVAAAARLREMEPA